MNGKLFQNQVNDLFFSDVNVEALHHGIQVLVYKRSNKKIRVGRQSDNELSVVMRSIYLQYSVNLQARVVDQVKKLNEKVLDYCVQNVLSNAHQYVTYLDDSSRLPDPLARAQNMSRAGSKLIIMEKI